MEVSLSFPPVRSTKGVRAFARRLARSPRLRGPGVLALRFLRESLFPSVRAGSSFLVVYGALVRAGVPCCCWGTESD